MGNNETKLDKANKAIRAIYKEKYYSVNEIDKKILNNCLEKEKNPFVLGLYQKNSSKSKSFSY